MNDNASGHQGKVEDDCDPPEDALPATNFQIPEHSNAHKETGNSARQMGDVTNLIMLIR